MAPTMKRAAMVRRRRFEPLPGRPGMGGRGLRERFASFSLGSISPLGGVVAGWGREGNFGVSGRSGLSRTGLGGSLGLRKPDSREGISSLGLGSPPSTGKVGGVAAGGAGAGWGWGGRGGLWRPSSREGPDGMGGGVSAAGAGASAGWAGGEWPGGG
jgi:hypothetical protein